LWWAHLGFEDDNSPTTMLLRVCLLAIKLSFYVSSIKLEIYYIVISPVSHHGDVACPINDALLLGFFKKKKEKKKEEKGKCSYTLFKVLSN
jgi:hypothetical protein